jgi:hypothetical protein
MKRIVLALLSSTVVACGGEDLESSDLDAIGKDGVDHIQPGDTDCPSCVKPYTPDLLVSSLKGSGVAAPYDNPSNALYQNYSYFSLGKTESGASPGEVIVGFSSNTFYNIPGVDMYIRTTTQLSESVEVAFSSDLRTWFVVGKITGSAAIDLSNSGYTFVSYKYLRMRSASAGTGKTPNAGPDIDGIVAYR